jgi:hypothetical protein
MAFAVLPRGATTEDFSVLRLPGWIPKSASWQNFIRQVDKFSFGKLGEFQEKTKYIGLILKDIMLSYNMKYST